MQNNNDLIIDSTYPSPNFNSRNSSQILHLVLHYTAGNFESSLKKLTDPKDPNPVSAHYLVPEMAMDGRRVFQLVQDKDRAWHAGVSSWGTKTNLNNTSIGIEIVNLGYQYKEGERSWCPFSDYQIQTVIALSQEIIQRYGIQPINVIGHSDIAPGRKLDPGPLFPWKKLYEKGIGTWFDEQALNIHAQENIDIYALQKNLKSYGYAIETTGELDIQTRTVLESFQMHFRPSNYSGNPDAETVAILNNLVQKYVPDPGLQQEVSQESLRLRV